MRCYYDLLISKGKVAAKLEFTNGGIAGLHGYSTYSYDSVNGVQAWFNAHQ
jgi:predicted HicB family RNase H-like nuclease